jgi:glycosyltransferase involved in cell wall biosynthesis
MRLALFADSPRPGGAEQVLVEIARAAHEAGHTVVVLTPQRWLADDVAARAPGVRARRVATDVYGAAPSRARLAGVLAAALPVLVRELLRAAPDVVHVSNGGFPGSQLCRLATIAARAAGVRRRVLTVHAVPSRRSPWQPRLQAGADRAVWASVDTVVGATEIVRDRLRTLRGMPDGLFVRIPYGVAEPGGRPEAAALRARLAEPSELLVGMVSATADAQKGHAVLVEALVAAPAVRAVIVGATPPSAVVARVDALGPRIELAGRVDDVGPYLHAIDALVLPSIADESLPLVALEALATGTPVNASRLSGIPEAIRDRENGCLFEPGDAPALAALLRQASDDRAMLARLGRQARTDWEQRFSVAAMTRAHLDLYERRPDSR